MNNTDSSQPKIDLDLPFAKQDYVQSLLGHPSIDYSNTLVSPELLHNFIRVANQWLKHDYLDFSENISGIKVGIEKLSIANSEATEYRVDSQFASNQDWRSEYDLNVLTAKDVKFLADTLPQGNSLGFENEVIDEKSEASNSFTYNFIDRVSEELYRLYPRLEEFQELHVYVFWNTVQIQNDLVLHLAFLPEERIRTVTSARSSCRCDDGNQVVFGYKKRNGKCTERGC